MKNLGALPFSNIAIDTIGSESKRKTEFVII